MDNIDDILRFNKKIEVTNSTNFIDETLEKLEKLEYILKLAKDKKTNIILFALIKLDCVYLSEFERLGLMKHSINYVFKNLENKGFIEKQERSLELWESMKDKCKSRDFNKIKFHKLTNQGFKFIAKSEILESLKLLVDKDKQLKVLEIKKERC